MVGARSDYNYIIGIYITNVFLTPHLLISTVFFNPFEKLGFSETRLIFNFYLTGVHSFLKKIQKIYATLKVIYFWEDILNK